MRLASGSGLARTIRIGHGNSHNDIRRTQELPDEPLSEESPPHPTEFFVFSFGDNTEGQLLRPTRSANNIDEYTQGDESFGNNRNVSPKPQLVLGNYKRRKISHLACGDNSTYVLSVEGDVWGGGSNAHVRF